MSDDSIEVEVCAKIKDYGMNAEEGLHYAIADLKEAIRHLESVPFRDFAALHHASCLAGTRAEFALFWINAMVGATEQAAYPTSSAPR